MEYTHVETNAQTGEVTITPFTQAEIDALQPTIEQQIKSFEDAVQNLLDGEAKARGYDNITTACSYAGAPNPFQVEAISFITWRGYVWAHCYAELEKVMTGVRPMPEIPQFLSELPVRVP